MTTEEFVVCLTVRGFSVADFDLFTYGMLVNYCKAYDAAIRRANGEEAPDFSKRYRQLKDIEPFVEEQFENGEISETEYAEYKKSLMEFEGG